MRRDRLELPLLHTHALDQPSVLTADALMREVRRSRQLKATPVPPVAVLDFDGDLFDGLVHDGSARPAEEWACFHTPMVTLRRHGLRCGPSEELVAALADSLASVAPVTRGLVWTTDAPYRETQTQVQHWTTAGALAVEMQAASLFAFARTRQAAVGVVAMVSNSGDHTGEQFDTGEHAYRVAVLEGIIAGAARVVRTFARRTSRQPSTIARR